MVKRCVIFCISYILAVLVLLVCLVSCFDETDVTVDASSPDSEMFTRVYDVHPDAEVYVHNDTGVMYFVIRGMNCAAMVVMVDAEGKPLIYTPVEVQE